LLGSGVDGFEFWNHAVANACPSQRQVFVGRIIVEPKSVFDAIGARTFPGESQKGSDDVIPLGGNSRQSVEAASAHQVHDDRLDVVRLGMRGRDEGAIKFERRLLEEAVAGFSPRLFEADFKILGHPGNVGMPSGKGNSQLLAEGFAPCQLVIRFGPLPVVQVGRHHVDLRLVEQMEKASGICPAAVTEKHANSGRDDPGLLQMSAKLLKHD
jgi:hypothetical protein